VPTMIESLLIGTLEAVAIALRDSAPIDRLRLHAQIASTLAEVREILNGDAAERAAEVGA
jgi:hypothetical protein